MIRFLAIIILLLTSSTALAQTMDLPSFFTPVEDDLSVWYLGNIFGSDLIEGERIPDQALMSRLFGVFNQVALVVGIIIIIYTMLKGTLDTANEGKPLGEKANSMWLPVRSVAGIALLVPKGGSGYVMSQYIVMWLTLQGIGAADTVWTTMVEFFEQGGAIRTYQIGGKANYMNTGTMAYTYGLQSTKDAQFKTALGQNIFDHNILEKMVCIEAFNNDEKMVELTGGNKYTAYMAAGHNNIINFGNRTAYDPDDAYSMDNRKAPGAECGQIRVELLPISDEPGIAIGDDEARQRIYTNALYNLARGLEGVSQDIVKNYPDEKNWNPTLFDQVNRNTQLFINYIVGYEQILQPPETQDNRDYEILKRYGWILAGNYYTMLASLEYKTSDMTPEFVVPADETVDVEFLSLPSGKNDKYYNKANKFMIDLSQYDGVYRIGDKYAQDPGEDEELEFDEAKTLGIVDIDKIMNKVRNVNTYGQASGSTTRDAVNTWIKYLSGGRAVAKDPIIRAATYGKELTVTATILLATLVPLLVGLNIWFSWKSSLTPEAWAVSSVTNILVPAIIALGVFMYAQGAMLGVFLPLIPFITFFIGVLGWMMQVVESIAAAPIVAIGLIFPETRDDIWGRAAPAYMLILNLFLRPSLMIIGFAAAMIMMWIAIELLNIGFLTLTANTFRIEGVFGFVTIMMAYSAFMLVIATKIYSMINMVPNKVLHWIGDQSMGIQGAEEAVGGVKQGAEAGGGAAAAGLAGLQQRGDLYRAERAGEKKKEEEKQQETQGGETAGEPGQAKTPQTPASSSTGANAAEANQLGAKGGGGGTGGSSGGAGGAV